DRLALLGGDLDGYDLRLEGARLDGGCGLRLAVRRELVLLLARIPYLLAMFSAVTPMCTKVIGHVRPSAIMESSSSSCPIRIPKRAFFRRYGAPLMLSMPPATMASAWPSSMACAASTTALRPEPHALFTVKLPTSFGTPASSAATRPGLRPGPAGSTWPRITSST